MTEEKTVSTLEKEQAGNQGQEKTLDNILSKTIEKHYSSETEAKKTDVKSEKKAEEITKVSDKQSDVKSYDSTDKKSEVKESVANDELPEDWSAGDKEEFLKLPKNIQDLFKGKLKNFQAGYTKKTQELSNKAKVAETVEELLKAYDPIIKQRNLSPEQAIKEILGYYQGFEKQLASNPEDFVKNIINSRKLDASRFIQDPKTFAKKLIKDNKIDIVELIEDTEDTISEVKSQGYSDNSPEVMALKQEVSELKRQMVDGEVNSFANSKDESGNKKFPHFEELKKDITLIIQAGSANGNSMKEMLEDAYNKAIRLNDKFYNEALSKEREKALAEVDEKRKEAVEKAKNAGSVKLGSTPSASIAKKSGKSLDEIISENLDRAGF